MAASRAGSRLPTPVPASRSSLTTAAKVPRRGRATPEWDGSIQESAIVATVTAGNGEATGEGTGEEVSRNRWTFLTNHAHVLVWISNNPRSRVRDIAASVGITERAAQSILRDLEHDGYVSKERFGRRNTYTVHPELPLRHPIEAHHAVGELLRLFRT